MTTLLQLLWELLWWLTVECLFRFVRGAFKIALRMIRSEPSDEPVPTEGTVFSPVVYCLTCGHAVPDAERFCPNCGTEPSKPPTPSTT